MKTNRPPSRGCPLTSIPLMALLAVPAFTPAGAAGSVRFVGGEVGLTAGGAPPMTFPTAFPGTGGHAARSDSEFAGETRVLYDLKETPGGAAFEVSQAASGDTSATFTLTFVTDAEMHYRFFAEPRPGDFSARFDGVVADAYYNPLGDGPREIYRGTLVHIDGLSEQPDGFEAKLFEGELEAGTHTLTVESSGGVDRDTVVAGGGLARLTLDPMTAAVPLPPGTWPALLTATAAAAVQGMRRRRRC